VGASSSSTSSLLLLLLLLLCVTRLCSEQLGLAGIWHADGSVRSEIETFVSRRGHVTDWHFDFQQNFALQLAGRKRWRLASSRAGAFPLR
jgi:hypothetical protein